MQPSLIVQPEGSSLCGQACVAMAAGVSLDRAIEAVGHAKKRGTYTREIVAGLRSLGIPSATRCKPLSKRKPVLPKRGLLAIFRDESNKRPQKFHWMLIWDGHIFDPGGRWPDGYDGWRITSYLEIKTH